MRPTGALLAALVLFVTGGCARSTELVPACVADAQCGGSAVCFAEGCGDPLTGLVIEVSGNGVGGQFSRDFAIDDGTLLAVKDLALGEPLRVLGEFQRDGFYSEPVRVLAVGASELVPGLSRVFETRVDQPVRGAFQMPIGAGRFRITAVPVDASVPPVVVRDVLVRSAFSAPAVNFAFPTLAQAVTLSGRLLKYVDTSKFPNVEVALTEPGAAMDLQAFDPLTRDPLSQRFPVSSGQAGANGNFTMTLSPRARALNEVLLIASPRDATQPMPTRQFTISTPLPTAVTLELGDTGAPLKVTGQAVDAAGLPLANAQVVLSGTVLGGGTFRSRVVLTDPQGTFALEALRAAEPQSLTILPPPQSRAAATTASVRLPDADGALLPGVVRCDDRITLRGQVLTPEGAPAIGIGVRADEQLAISGPARPLPLEASGTTTDGLGEFALPLDPGTWRLEFTSGGLRPMASRLVVVTSTVDGSGAKVLTQTLAAPVSLARGRRVTGLVTGSTASSQVTPVPYATVRFFRVAPGEASPAILLGTTVADEQGLYSITLPR